MLKTHPYGISDIVNDPRLNPGDASRNRFRIYKAINKHPTFKFMQSYGSLKHKPVPGTGPGKPTQKWHFNQMGLNRTVQWLQGLENPKVETESVAVKSEQGEGLGLHIYRICSVVGVEPVFDDLKLNLRGTMGRVADAIVHRKS